MCWKNNFPKKNRYFETENGILYHDDCTHIINQLPDNSINLVVTSPPYNVHLGYNKYKKNGYNLYNDNKEHKDYINWLTSIFFDLYPKFVKGGRMAINVGDGKNGKVPTHSDLIQSLSQKYLLSSIIIWDKKQVGNRTSWGSFNSPSNVSYPTPFEFILLFAKQTFKLQHKGVSDLSKNEFVKWAYALWDFLPETKMKNFNHPAMFPEELPKRCIKMNSYVNDLVVDVFAGAGTTLLTAEKLNRRWIGVELDEHYCEIVKQRFANIQISFL